MLTLYYAPGACSMASHIALEESGALYESKPVALAQGEHMKPEYLNNVNSRGKVPALQTDDGVLTENVGILTYLARSFPDAMLMPTDPLGTARALSHMAYLSNTVHPAFTHIMRPGRFASDESAHENLKATGKENFWKLLQEIDGLLDGKDYVLGDTYSVADPYTLVFYGWGKRIGLPVGDLKNYTAFKDRMLQRPAVKKVLEREQSPLLAA
ncbi:MAG TPA: glutathione S-transferase N-terminal domain-containing protein [Stellaceae bacterium]|jgi:glutathione S-transferase|nr:glutathione S-transferase N-terminal domain-containing protein [Stellaceae bacterium]